MAETACRNWLENYHVLCYYNFIYNFNILYVPFCVLTGVPEVREPATDSGLAKVDISFNRMFYTF